MAKLCTRCQKPLEGEVVYLVVDWATNRYYPTNHPHVATLAEDRDGGAQPFGKACARAVLRNGGEL